MKKTDPYLYSMQKQPSGLGVALGILCSGLCLLIFPHIAGEMSLWLAWVFYGLGLLFLLVGVLCSCSIVFE
jgi:hypothetical protein